MKKMLFISLLGLMLTMTANNVLAQRAQQCCFWLENFQPAAENEQFSLNPTVVGNTDYYAIRYNNTCELPDASKISIDWEIWDITDGTPVKVDGDLFHYAEVTIQTWIEGEKQWVGTPLKSGMGLSSTLANPRDFPGGIDNPYVFTYMETMPKFNYNFLYLHWLQYASDNTLMRLKIEWKQWGKYKIVMKLMERTNGTDYQLYYDDNATQHKYYGGHAAILGRMLAADTLTVLHVGDSVFAEVCSGDVVELGRQPISEGSKPYEYAFTVIAPAPALDTIVMVNFYNPNNTCIDKLDSIVPLRMLVNPKPDAPTVPNVDSCGDGEMIITASHDLHTTNPGEYTINYRWYEYVDEQKGDRPIHEGLTVTTPLLAEGESISYYVTAVIENENTRCEGTNGTVVTATARYIPQATMTNDENYCPTVADVEVFVTVTNGEDLVPSRPMVTPTLPPFNFTWENATAFSLAEDSAYVHTIAKCDSTYEFSVKISDRYCSAIFESSFTTQDEGTPPSFTVVDTFFYLTELEEACNFDATTYPTDISDNCSQFELEEITVVSADDTLYYYEPEFELLDVAVDVYAVITRTWTVTDICGNDSIFDQIITIYDTIAPVIEDYREMILAQIDVECTYRIAEGTIELLRERFNPTDNCTAQEEIDIQIYIELAVEEGDAIELGRPYAVEFTDKQGNTTRTFIRFMTDIVREIEITVEPENPCWDASVTLTAVVTPDSLNPYTYEWIADGVYFEDDNNTSASVTATPVEPNTDNITYTYYLTVTDKYGCVMDTMIEVETLPAPVFELVEVLPMTGCREDVLSDLGSIEVTQEAGFDYFYSYEDGERIAFIDNHNNGLYKIDSLFAGNYTVTAVDKITGCEYTIEDVEIEESTHMPIAHLSLNGEEGNIALCIQDSLEVRGRVWYGNEITGDIYKIDFITPGGVLSFGNDSLRVFQAGDYAIGGVVINETKGCTATVYHTIYAKQLPEFEIDHTPFCEGDVATLSIMGLTTTPSTPDTIMYFWNWRGAPPSHSSDTVLNMEVTRQQKVTAKLTAIYRIESENVLECSTTDSIEIIPVAKPSFGIEVTNTIECELVELGKIALTEVAEDYEYSYIYNEGSQTPIVNFHNNSLTDLAVGDYTIIAFDAETGCQTEIDTVITVNPFDIQLLADFDMPLIRDVDTFDLAFCFEHDTTVYMRLDYTGSPRFGYTYSVITPEGVTQQQSIEFKVIQPGDYIIQGYVRNDTTGCVSEIDTLIIRAIPKPEFTLLPGDVVNVCYGSEVCLSVNSTEEYQITWTWGSTPDTDEGDELCLDETMTLESENYYLHINNPLVDTVQCSIDTVIKVTVHELEEPALEGSGEPCEAVAGYEREFKIFPTTASPQGATYAWYKNDELLGNETTDTLAFTNLTQDDNGTYKMIVSFYACVDSAEYDMAVGLPTDSTYNDSICEGAVYTLNGHEINTEGLANTVIIDTLWATNAVGCDSLAIVKLFVRPLPELEVVSSATLPLCYDAGTDLAVIPTGNAPFTYEWWYNEEIGRWGGIADTQESLSDDDSLYTTPSLTDTTEYFVVVTDMYGCENIEYFIVPVLPELVIDPVMLEGNEVICAGENVDINFYVNDGLVDTRLVIQTSTDEGENWIELVQIPITTGSSPINIDSVIDIATWFRAWVQHDANNACATDTTEPIMVDVYPDPEIAIIEGIASQEVCEYAEIEAIYFAFNGELWSPEAEALGLVVLDSSISGTPAVAPGIYTFWVVDTIAPCGTKDSLQYTLTIHKLDTTVFNVIECGEYTWIENEVTYDTSGTYFYTVGQSQNGCDSILRLDLTINPVPAIVSHTPATADTLCYGATTEVEFEFNNDGTAPFTVTYVKDASEDTLEFTFDATPYVLELGAGDYEFIIITDGLCYDSALAYSVTIAGYDNPELTLDAEPQYCLASNAECTATTVVPGNFYSKLYSLDGTSLLDEVSDETGTLTTFTHTFPNAIEDVVYFVVKFVDNASECEYVDSTQTILISDNPGLNVYTTSHDITSINETSVNTGEEVVFYFQINNGCNMDDNTRLAVDYVYNHADTAITTLNNYLWSPAGSPTVNYSTEMTECTGTGNVNYNYDLANSSYPKSATVGDPNISFMHGNNTYSFFRLEFINEREVKVTISGFNVPGVYVIDFELITHITAGQILGGGMCSSVVLGGDDFFVGNYVRQVLATNTMTIEVLGSAPAQGDDGGDDNVSIKEIADAKSEMLVYPNPSSAVGNVTVKLTNIEGNTSIRMVSMDGKVITEMQHNITDRNETMIDLSVAGVAAGVYHIVVTNNEAVLTKKLVVQ